MSAEVTSLFSHVTFIFLNKVEIFYKWKKETLRKFQYVSFRRAFSSLKNADSDTTKQIIFIAVSGALSSLY